MKSSETLLIIRQNLIDLFKRYEVILLPILRFIMSLMGIHMLKEATGYSGGLSHICAMLAIALIGSFVSAEGIVIGSILLTVIFLIPSNFILAIMLFLVLTMIYILFGRLFPRECILVIVTLAAFSTHLELMLSIGGALFGSYVSIVAIIIGTVLWFMMPEIRANMPSGNVDKGQIIDTINQLFSIDFKGLLVNQNMMVTIIVFFIVFSTIYFIRKLSVDYGAYIAITIGAAMNIIGFGLASMFFMDLHINMIELILKTVLFSVIAVVMQFFAIALDYQRAETVEFQDDDNYYYVKIVPKIKLHAKHKKVKKVYTDLSQTMSGKQRYIKEDDFTSGL